MELTPYVWLPAAHANINLGPNDFISASRSTGVPSAAEITSSLHGAFMGYGLARYGPWSAEMDVDWVAATSNNKVVAGPLGRSSFITASASLVRVAPGFGYQVMNSAVASIPLTIDVRTGFSWFHWNSTISSGIPSLNGGSSFVQPWLGTRFALYPAPRWRITLDALAQGFGVGGGSWGWATTLVAAYAVTDWIDVGGGIRALKTSREETNAGLLGLGKRSLDIVSYGPIAGVGFRF